MSSLLDIIFYSEKRREILFLLMKCALNLEQMKFILNETSVSILPQLKKLTDYKLIYNIHGIYKLTTLGHLITKKILTLIGTTNAIDRNINFWLNCDFSSFPQMFLHRLGDIGHFDIMKIDLRSIFYEPNFLLIKILEKTDNLTIFTNLYREEHQEVFKKRIIKKLHTKIITTIPIIQKIKIKLKDYLDSATREYIEIFQVPINTIVEEIILTNDVLILSLKTLKENLDLLYIINSEPSSLKFGKDLLDYFESQSMIQK